MPEKQRKRTRHSLPVVAAGAEFLTIGYLMRRNILAYKAPPMNEGYDLICIHPSPRHQPNEGEKAQVRVQVKSRYQTDSDHGFPVKKKTLDAFDFLVAVFLNIGNYYRGRGDGSEGIKPVDFYTFPREIIPKLYDPKSGWDKVYLRRFKGHLEQFHNERGFELIAAALGVPKPTRPAIQQAENAED